MGSCELMVANSQGRMVVSDGETKKGPGSPFFVWSLPSDVSLLFRLTPIQ